ncbi:MAG: phosphate regulon sensor histidine kinase PhoR [Gammaproteobacteria bacterium]|nr:phosphate regulon sensor histidine kinase PhoR [Gammaproteobacteria bacterium]NIR84035.1 phosphate regulon sensor histidine kinase PhoR [Gammaproteobacteria bacterium]NIR89179.1 phosphate regulon sensor histidine kinase PhoR [Gammaproteobacteria bacterium]NIU04981.1 phosphate regulon sensor histidine kinase PhoR [Gammaproteobacteria bacterium]NIV52147.1 phosphate regulon sensor histidine kinase PhoR [Gammaproteobacteria bacterium]
MQARGWWLRELRTLLLGGGAAALAGLLVGHVLAFVLAACFFYLLVHLYYLYCLERWLRDRKGSELPNGRGAWRHVFAELHRLRRKSRRRKQHLEAFIDRFLEASNAMPDAVVVLRPDGTLEWCNQTATTLLGLQRPHDLGQAVTNLIRDPAFREYLHGRVHEHAVEIVSPEDDNARVSIRIVPYGQDRRLLIAHDVTRLHRLERMRQDFVANLSHELRMPLTVIKGYVETLTEAEKAEQTPERWRRPLEHIKQQTERMCTLVADLVQLSRLDGPVRKRPQAPVRVAEMLEHIRTDALNLQPECASIHLEAEETLRILGDHSELHSAFLNLLANAVRHTPPSSDIYVRWYRDEQGAHLQVRDTGEGIEAHHIPRLTERFYRVDKGRSRASGGSGLGLAIVKHALMRHEATLRIESKVGEGSTFTCDFPRWRIVAQTPAAATS